MFAEMCGFDEMGGAYHNHGVCDILVENKADTMDDLEQKITRRMWQVLGVRSTLTKIVSKQYK